STGNLYHDPDGYGARTAGLIATLQGAPTIVATDLAVDASYQGVVLNGTAGNDSIVGSAGSDILSGLDGNDTLNGGASGMDTFYGGAGDDSIVGVQGSSWFFGQDGDDTIVGVAGSDTSYEGQASGTGPGNDILDRRASFDWL